MARVIGRGHPVHPMRPAAALALWALACGQLAGCPTTSEGDAVVIGGLFYEQTYEGRVVGAEMAIDDFNEAGVFDRELRFDVLRFNNSLDRTELARELFDEHGAIALVSEYSTTAKLVLQLTNDTDGPYSDIVQCNGSSTSTTINDPDTPPEEGWAYASDRNDTLYRTVASDAQQARVLWSLVEDPDKLAVYWSNDAYGQSFRAELLTYLGEDHELAFDESFDGEDFSIEEAEEDLEALLERNHDGNVETTILLGLYVANPMVKELTESDEPYEGTLIIPEGNTSMFTDLTADFTTWFDTAGNRIIGTGPENHAGTHSDEWFERLLDRAPSIDPDGSVYSTTVADCGYALGLAMMIADEADRYGRPGIHGNMPSLKDPAYDGADDVVLMSPDAAGIEEARAALDAGQPVKLDGASGVITFTGDGDRSEQLYATRKVVWDDESDAYKWEDVSLYNGSTGDCIENCGD